MSIRTANFQALILSLFFGLFCFSSARAQLIPNGTYEITVESSGMPMSSSGTTDGSAITQQTYANAATQKWIVTNLGGNVVELVLGGTTEALEAPGSTTTAGALLDTHSYSGGSNQKWTIVSVGSGFYEIVNVNSGYEANVSGGANDPGENICQWTAGNAPNAVWAFTAIAGPTGSNAMTFNLSTLASGANSDAFNDNTAAESYDSFALGRFNVGGYAAGGETSWISTDPLLEAGNGTDSSHLSDAFVLYKNGNAVFQGSVQVAPGGDIPMYTGN